MKMVAEKPVSLLAAKQPQIKKLILNLCFSSETTFFSLFFLFSLLVFSIHGIRHFSGRELRQLGDGGNNIDVVVVVGRLEEKFKFGS